MDDYLKLYERNKKLDDIFNMKYKEIEAKLYEKNCLELVVELGELANESRCFKYWSIKKANKELLLEEYADCLIMVLYMFNYYNVTKIYDLKVEYSDDILFVFNDLIRMCTKFMVNVDIDDDYLMNVFNYLLHLGELLKFTHEEIIDACYKKIIKNEERLSSDY